MILFNWCLYRTNGKLWNYRKIPKISDISYYATNIKEPWDILALYQYKYIFWMCLMSLFIYTMFILFTFKYSAIETLCIEIFATFGHLYQVSELRKENNYRRRIITIISLFTSKVAIIINLYRIIIKFNIPYRIYWKIEVHAWTLTVVYGTHIANWLQ